MKSFLKNLWYIIEINIILAIPHFFTLIAIAFNDTGEHYDTIIDAIPYIWNGLLVLNVTSIIMGFVYRKKQDFNVIQYIISQLLIIFLWVLFYVSNLVG